MKTGEQKMTQSRSELLHLKNLGMSSVNILHAIGVNTREDLKNLGSVEAYRRIKARGIKVSKVMLYAVEGALLDLHWNELDINLKKRLVIETERNNVAGESCHNNNLVDTPRHVSQ